MRQPQATSIIIITEGGKRAEMALISFNPLVWIVVFGCRLANDLLTVPVTAALRPEERRVANNVLLFFYILRFFFWSIELQHYKRHRIREIGGKEGRRGGVCHGTLNFAIASLP